MNTENMRTSLDSVGFNLFSVLDSGSVTDDSLPFDCKSLLLIGSAGDDLWQKIPAAYRFRDNPVDDYTSETIERLTHQYLPEGEWQILFPARSAVTGVPNLQQLGSMAGWHHPSPLGNGINRKYGLWFAYRAVVAISAAIVPSDRQTGESPCLSCTDTPCLSACPASALSVGRVPDLGSCMQYRTAAGSACEEDCLARRSCPVAPEWRYSDEQIKYFYGRSLLSLRDWVASDTDRLSGE